MITFEEKETYKCATSATENVQSSLHGTIQGCSAIQRVPVSAPSSMSHKYDFKSSPSFKILFILYVPFFLNIWSLWKKVGLSVVHKTSNYFYLRGMSRTFYQRSWKNAPSSSFYLITHSSGFPSDYKIMLIFLNLAGKKISQTYVPSLATFPAFSILLLLRRIAFTYHLYLFTHFTIFHLF